MEERCRDWIVGYDVQTLLGCDLEEDGRRSWLNRAIRKVGATIPVVA